ncbi:uncharacterized protein MONBRDRAFT_37222 [Monosiga brevicollis MX1]|uniref:Acetyltransferase component of pyruvate dehydrogenase complex n=1 Tax=Monosiga brevicollis TaxID=81824 RepID=A9V0D2_MONBE|nr:uncharacterized protein MONBRDRAFT_37222 [Monosiga brevicollis MX1]EDQ89136.1 predicted protein [Monosiga brevicollis MX1]|eukprot:XP_001746241.1 hypothetical protein [Monosiga brevicollis MX1]
MLLLPKMLVGSLRTRLSTSPVAATLRQLSVLGSAVTMRQSLRQVPILAQSRLYASDLPSHIVVNFPALSPTMTTGTLMEWQVAVGDEVAAGDALGQVETDKAAMAFESTEDGFVAKLLVEDGTSDIAIGQPVMVLVEDKDDIPAFENFTPEASATPEPKKEEPKAEPEPAKDSQPATPAPTPAPSPSTTEKSGDRIFASPLARRLAAQAEIALDQLNGSGPRGRITRADVEAYQQSAPAPAAGASTSTKAASPAGSDDLEYTDVPLSNMRKVIAKRLQESKQQVPHYYLTSDVNVDAVLALRQQFNAEANGEYKLSVNDFVIKASAAALQDVTECNSAWMDTFIREYDSVDISVAVSTDAGLITPIVFDADLKGLREISENVKELAGRAREGKLAPEEYQGGTFTISNLGMYGVSSFSAIINPPQACILAVWWYGTARHCGRFH